MDCQTTEACLKYLLHDDTKFIDEYDNDDNKPFEMVSESSSSLQLDDEDESSSHSDVEQSSFKSLMLFSESETSSNCIISHSQLQLQSQSSMDINNVEDERKNKTALALFPRLDIGIYSNQSFPYLSDTNKESSSIDTITETPSDDHKFISSNNQILDDMSLMKTYCVDELGINRSDNNSFRDNELFNDPNWWISKDYFMDNQDKYVIDFEYHTSVIDYGVLI